MMHTIIYVGYGAVYDWSLLESEIERIKPDSVLLFNVFTNCKVINSSVNIINTERFCSVGKSEILFYEGSFSKLSSYEEITNVNKFYPGFYVKNIYNYKATNISEYLEKNYELEGYSLIIECIDIHRDLIKYLNGFDFFKKANTVSFVLNDFFSVLSQSDSIDEILLKSGLSYSRSIQISRRFSLVEYKSTQHKYNINNGGFANYIRLNSHECDDKEKKSLLLKLEKCRKDAELYKKQRDIVENMRDEYHKKLVTKENELHDLHKEHEKLKKDFHELVQLTNILK